ncbi:L-lactate dehydrogenase [Jejuia pallidilutea]|nr:L-lactate dehydrogenase [Jejuia pallidilutea]
MYGVSALGKKGGNHTISLLKTELQQVMEQLCCEKTTDFSKYLI